MFAMINLNKMKMKHLRLDDLNGDMIKRETNLNLNFKFKYKILENWSEHKYMKYYNDNRYFKY